MEDGERWKLRKIEKRTDRTEEGLILGREEDKQIDKEGGERQRDKGRSVGQVVVLPGR